MKKIILFLSVNVILWNSCVQQNEKVESEIPIRLDTLVFDKKITTQIEKEDIRIEKDFLYDQYTLTDTYPYKDTTRVFQWDKIKTHLFLLDSIQLRPASWGILQNYKNRNGEAPLVKKYARNVYKRIADTLGVERYQSVPLFLSDDTITGVRYGRDGSLVKYIEEIGSFIKVETIHFEGEWYVPKRYVKPIGDTVSFKHAVVVDVTNQNIATLERNDSLWLVRSMNPATTGVHRPPYAQETPVGMYVIQEKKVKMYFLKDGSTALGGFAPYASRFTNGAYVHGIPVNSPRTAMIEYGQSLGTTPRSHMCVRNATSHAKFVYEWAPVQESIVFVID